MREFSDHPVFATLHPSDLRSLVAGWVEDLVRGYAHLLEYPEQPPDRILDALYVFVREGRSDLTILPDDQWEIILNWLQGHEREPLLAAIAQKCIAFNSARQRTERVFKKATPDQLRIIMDAQKEVGLNFSRFFPELTSWEADAVIKGIVAISEVQRITNDRHFALRDLRAAIRNHLQDAAAPPPSRRRTPRELPQDPDPRDRSWPSSGTGNIPGLRVDEIRY